MVRIKRGAVARKKKKRLFQQVKGFRWGRKNRLKLAKDALRHAWEYSFRDRKAKKAVFRQSWQQSIQAAAKAHDISYSRLIAGLKTQNIQLDRKVLAELAKTNPEAFGKIVAKVK